jgi:uncharacterized membrane protein
MIEKNKIEGDEIMKSSKTILCAIVTIVFIFAGAASAYYPVIDLGTLNGDPNSYAWSVNDSGQIVGWDANDSGDSRACIFDNTGGGANINLGGSGSGPLSSDSGSGALSSNSNQIVGLISYYENHSHPLRYSRACIFDSTGGGANKDLGTIGGLGNMFFESFSSGAQSINNSGQIVGWAQDRSIHPHTYYEHACLFDSEDSNNNKDLKTLGGYESEALCINDSNKIVGWADKISNYEHACIFDSTGDSNNNIDLGTLGGDSSMAWSINNNNQIVGWALDGLDNYRACLFDPTGGGANKDLRTLEGDYSEAYCINDNGQIVGYALDDLGQSRACFFDKTGGGNNIDLNTLINPASGWTLTYASSINNEGWIVGSGIHNGQEHAFLFVITTIILTSPNGGEVLTAGSTYPITWLSTGPISNVIIKYSTNNRQSWNSIATAANTGSYDWLVPALNSHQCFIRIIDFADPTISDTSDAVFTIINTIYVDNDAPNDPGPNNPDYSDPLEDGTPGHPFDAIQEGIDVAVNGDTVIVQPGVYSGNGNCDIDFKGKAITVRSTSPNDPDIAAATIVNCNGTNHRGFKFVSNEGQDSILEGLTITNAHILIMCEGGAGIYIDGASPTINKCVVTNNRAELVQGSRCLCLGGGIYIGAESNPLISDCIISDNSVGDWGWGGGIYCDYSATHTTLRNCLISNNTALGYEGAGGGIYCDGPSDLTVANCTIVDNSAAEDGGGIYFYIYESPIRTISNSIIWGNSPDQIYPVDETNIFGTYSDIQGGWSGTGNINIDPCFADAANDDYHLKSEGWRWDQIANQWTWDDVTSRCIDAGNPGWPLGDEPTTLDVDPLNRWGENLRIDMGMYGGRPEASMPPYGWALLSDMDNSGKVDFVDYSYLANLYGEEGQNLSGDLNRDGKVNIEDISLIAFDWLEFTDWAED